MRENIYNRSKSLHETNIRLDTKCLLGCQHSSLFCKASIKLNKLMALVPGGVRMAFAVVNEVAASPAELVFFVPGIAVVFVTVTFTPITNKTSKVPNVILALFEFYNFIKR
jgi:hypothetical protein